MRHACAVHRLSLGLVAFDSGEGLGEVRAKLFIVALVLLVLVLIPGVGKGVNGARRWIPLAS
jgi:cell division protein FtsW